MMAPMSLASQARLKSLTMLARWAAGTVGPVRRRRGGGRRRPAGGRPLGCGR